MKKSYVKHIVLGVVALIAAAVLFVNYGTVLPSAPFAAVPFQGPSAAATNGELTVIADSGATRALILNSDNDLTGVVSCTTVDSPLDAITDVCVSDGTVFVSGVRFLPDSDFISQERVAAYDKGGNFLGLLYDGKGSNSASPSIKSLNDVEGGVVIAFEHKPSDEGAEKSQQAADAQAQKSSEAADAANENYAVSYEFVSINDKHDVARIETDTTGIYAAAYAGGKENHFAILNVRGMLIDGVSGHEAQAYAGHVFTAIEVDNDGVLYACDDSTGSACAIPAGSTEVRQLVAGNGYDRVHVSNGILSLCDTETNKMMLCDTAGTPLCELTEVKPSIGFSARMVLVLLSAAYLATLAVVLIVRKILKLVREKNTKAVGPALLAVAIVSAIAVATGSLSFNSYQSALETRAREIGMCAAFLESTAPQLSEAMEKIGDRNKLHANDSQLNEAATNLLKVAQPALQIVNAADANGIGMYCTIYDKDDKGIFYVYGTAEEHVLGTAMRLSGAVGLEEAFAGGSSTDGKLLRGQALRDTSQYRLVRIPATSGNGTAGVIEIGSKMRSFESSITGNLARNVLAMLVLVLVVYLAYTEVRACGRCLVSYSNRRHEGADTISIITRPFTLAITMLTSIDSVMTVLIARELLASSGGGDSNPLLALPAVMLGVGMVIGQALYGFAGSRVGLRKLMVGGGVAMLLFAAFTGFAVLSGMFWLYCVAKLTMAVPFGMLYSLGYSLPRLARNEEDRALAAGGVKRTDTSAAALGTVLGGYAAQALGNVWVYALVGMASLVVIIMTLSLLPSKLAPLETLARQDHRKGRIGSFIKTPRALGIAFLVILPGTVAAGYASFLFPLFSVDFGLSKADINNIVVFGQVIVFICISTIERVERSFPRKRIAVAAIGLLGVVFLLFSVNTTIAWSVAVIALVGLFCKTSDVWKGLWLNAAADADVPAGSATGAMFAVRSLSLVAQPFILGALLGFADNVAVIVIGAFCLFCAANFYLLTRNDK